MQRTTRVEGLSQPYANRRWRRLRRLQLQKEPLCRLCKAQGKIEPAVVADHVHSHRGNRNAFWLNELQSLCKRCHDLKTQGERDVILHGRQLLRGCDVTGMPLDKRHWAWQERSPTDDGLKS